MGIMRHRGDKTSFRGFKEKETLSGKTLRIKGLWLDLAIITITALLFLPSISFAVQAVLTDDAFTSSHDPTRNYGSDRKIKIQDPSPPPTTYTGFLKFDISTLPARTLVTDIGLTTRS